MARGISFDSLKAANLRRRLLLALGISLFAAGALILAIGLYGYFTEGDGDATTAVQPPPSLDEIEGLPVAIPYYNPRPEPPPAPATVPLRIVIEKIAVDNPVIELGLDEDGIPFVPKNGQDVAWYTFSSKPGDGSNAVFAGHINWEGHNGAFGSLNKLAEGDLVKIVSEDGREYVYSVFAAFAVDPNDPESLKVMASTPTDQVTLITCGGTWVPDSSEEFGGQYTIRTIVQAKLVETTAAAADTASDRG